MSRLSEDEGLILCARTQTKGRGRHNRPWAEGTGNLYASLLLKPEIPAARLGSFSLVAGLSIAQGLQDALHPFGPTLSLKWPNDVLLHGEKLAGVLLETSEIPGSSNPALVFGFGINLQTAPLAGATALNLHGLTLTPEGALDRLLPFLQKNYKKWKDDGFAPFRSDWLALSNPIGTAVSVKIGAKILRGHFADLSPEGHLLLREEGSGALKTITSGDIVMTPPDERQTHASGG